jgi:hypothetical protein
MLLEAALLPINLSSHLLRFHFITVPVPGIVTETGTGAVIDYGFGSAKAKTYGSYGSGSATLVFQKSFVNF